MNVTYDRTMEQSHITFEATQSENTFEEKMLSSEIPGILPFRVNNENGVLSYSYDITNKQSIDEFIELHEISTLIISRLLKFIINTIIGARSYLLTEDDFLIDTRYIFVGDNGQSFWLCYYIGYQQSVKEQLRSLFEEWMKIIDYDDSSTVRLVYELYRLSKLTTCTYEQILSAVSDTKSSLDKEETSYNDSILSNNGADKISSITRNNNITTERSTEQIVAMMEEIEGEKEILYYPIRYYGYVIISAILGILGLYVLSKTTLLKNSYGQFDLIKFCCISVVATATQIIIGKKIFCKEHLNSKMIPIKEMVSIHENETNKPCQTQTQVQQFEDATYDKYGKAATRDDYLERPTEMLFEDTKTQILLNHEMLTLIPRTHDGEPIVINTREARIGSSKKHAQIILPYSTISRNHARILYEDGTYYVEDSSSTNGTFLNGVRLSKDKRNSLSNKDQLQFAEYYYEVQIGNLLNNDI